RAAPAGRPPPRPGRSSGRIDAVTTDSSTGLTDRLDPVGEWSARRTYRGTDFRAEQLVAAKSGRRVSVVLPARNEEATVGRIVRSLHEDLVERTPLIDELVVVDSHSTDATAAVATRAGARVVAQGEVLPALGDEPGKGEALWKSLAATDGDVIAFIDSDLREFDTHYAVGLLGPLLTDPGVVFCKGAYDRPLDDGRTVLPAGGGRITELVARPLLAAHWPGLAGVIPPLAREDAGTREARQASPFAGGVRRDRGRAARARGAPGRRGIRPRPRHPHRPPRAARPRRTRPGGPGRPHAPQPPRRGTLGDGPPPAPRRALTTTPAPAGCRGRP